MKSKLTIDQFNYQLPEEMIAQRPAAPRDESRLMLVDRSKKKINPNLIFKQLPQLLVDKTSQNKPLPVLVRNNTKVIPARIIGQKNTGGQVELLLLKPVKIGSKNQVWECLTKPGLKPGQTVSFSSQLKAKCLRIDGYTRHIQFNQSKSELMTSLLKIGQTPTPPYIDWKKEDEPKLRKQYQTTYAQIQGSAAAPTAGLHFTKQVDQKLQKSGIEIEEVTLHVGLGTFQPVKVKNIKDHQMHSEWFELKPKTASKLNQAKKQGRKIIAVGTTTTRVLESCANQTTGLLKAQTKETDIFIAPGYKFKFVQGLITNFHLPQSTLLMLISALVSKPNTNQKFKNFQNSLAGQAYQQAIASNYRFYSFGDAMLIW